jgi:hypothetical protein
MAVQDERVPGTRAWARLSKKERAKELDRLHKKAKAAGKKTKAKRGRAAKAVAI